MTPRTRGAPGAADTGLTHRLFELGVIAKAIDGGLEVVGGVLMFFVTPERTERVVRGLTENEIFGNAHNAIVTHMVHAVRHLSSDTMLFAAIYLLGHGVIKLVLVVGLLRKLRWAYVAAIIAFILFLLYQGYRYTETASIGLLILSALDLFVIAMTILEYRRLRADHAFA